MALAAATGAWLAAIAEDGYLVRATLLAAFGSAALLAGGLVLRRSIVIPAAVCVLAAPYVASLGFEVDGLDARAPLIAGLLFAVAELAYWSLELRDTLADEPGTYLRRIALLAGLAVGTIAAGTVVLALVEGISTAGAAVDLAGAIAAVGAIALLALAASRRTDQ
ncbi:MAG: hypothetical protein ABIR67_00090 [Gaiellaceae bacterium]